MNWIKVSERLPEPGQLVNVIWNGRVTCAMLDQDLTETAWQEGPYGDYDTGVEVTHWMPLPSPPEDEE